MGSSNAMMVGMMGSIGMFCCCLLALCLTVLGPKMLSGLEGGQDVPPDEMSEVPRAERGCIYLFEDKDGQGTPFQACLGGKNDWSVADLRTQDYNDKANVLDVGPGVTVKLYEDINFNGNKSGKRVIIKSSPEWVDLDDLGFGKKVSSIRLSKN